MVTVQIFFDCNQLPNPIADAAPTCTKPVIAGGEVSPTDNEIAVGAVYTVTCNAHHKMKGEAEMTCSKSGDTAVLSAAPECEEGRKVFVHLWS